MKGTILDFLKLANEKPELAQELVDLAAKHDFEFSDEVSDKDLESVAGGVGGTDPMPYSNIGSIASRVKVTVTDKSVSDPSIPISSGDEAGATTDVASAGDADAAEILDKSSSDIKFEGTR